MLTAERLREVLDYDPETGLLTRRVTCGTRGPAGVVAGCLRVDGYLEIGIDGTLYLAHRLAWLYMTGEWPKGEIDHFDMCRTNNRRDNLRDASAGENRRNRRCRRDNECGVKGVKIDKRSGRWRARISVDGKRVSLGQFSTMEAAGEAYQVAARRLHREFART